jgi:hypothetical protein
VLGFDEQGREVLTFLPGHVVDIDTEMPTPGQIDSLAELKDHNCWTMAEAAGHPAPYRMQHLLSRARVDEGQMLDAAADWGSRASFRRPGRGCQ